MSAGSRTLARDGEEERLSAPPQPPRLSDHGEQPGHDGVRGVAVAEVVDPEEEEDEARPEAAGFEAAEPPERVCDAVAGQPQVEKAGAGPGGREEIGRQVLAAMGLRSGP